MFYFLLVLLILDAFLLMVVVLLQAGKGGGLAAVGGGGGAGDTLLGSRQAVTLLTKATWWTGGIFLVLCMILSMMSAPARGADPILRGGATPGAVPGVAEPTQPAGGQLTPGIPGEQAQPAAPEPVTPQP